MSLTMEGRVRWMGRLGAVALVTLLAVGCDDDPVAPDAVVYEGDVVGVGEYAALSGEAVFEASSTGIGVTLALAEYPEEGDGFPWLLREGTCAEPGAALGDPEDYPLIEIDESGAWSGEVTLEVDDEVDAYVIELRRSPEDEESVIACGDLTRV